MMRSTGLLFASLALGCATTTVIPPPSSLAEVRDECRKVVADGRLPSLAIAVAVDGRLIWKEAFGMADIEAARPATTDTIYTLASTGKSITGTAVLVAAQQGLVDLDVPVDRYLGDALRVYEGNREKITVRTLAAMAVGIPHLWWHHWHDEGPQPLSNKEIVRRYGIVTVAPGTGFHYSNLTYGVLAQVIENATGMPFHEFVQSNVLDPLGMRHASVRPQEKFADLAAVSYGGKFERRPYWYSDPEGGAGYRASISDLIAYAMFHLGDRQPGQKAIIDRSILDEVHDPRKSGYRFGWVYVDDVSGVRTAIANGGIVGAASIIRLVPEQRIAVAVLTNYPDRLVDSLADRVITALVPQYRGEMVIPPEFKTTPFVADEHWAGEWTGEVRTWEGATPIRAGFESGTGWISIAGAARQSLGTLNLENGAVRGRCACTVPLGDTHGEPSRLDVALRRDGDRLYGSVNIVSTGPRTNFSLPAYISLSR